MTYVLAGMLLLIALSFLVFLAVAGFFTPVRITRVTAGPVMLVYERMRGDYAKSGRIMDAMYRWLQARGVRTFRGFGYYFDDPRRTAKRECRAVVGHVLEPADVSRREAIEERYDVKTFPAQACLQVEASYRGRASILAGLMKAYPALQRYLKHHDLPQRAVMEIYDAPNRRILYWMPLDPPSDPVATYFG